MPFIAGRQAFLEILKAIDFVGLARALGVPGEGVTMAAEVIPALSRGLAAGGPYLPSVEVEARFKP